MQFRQPLMNIAGHSDPQHRLKHRLHMPLISRTNAFVLSINETKWYRTTVARPCLAPRTRYTRKYGEDTT